MTLYRWIRFWLGIVHHFDRPKEGLGNCVIFLMVVLNLNR